jgi:hypothetical protein
MLSMIPNVAASAIQKQIALTVCQVMCLLARDLQSLDDA